MTWAEEQPARNTLRSWPVEQSVYLTLDLECDYGTAMSERTYEAARNIDDLIKVLEKHSVPLTCFLQTEVLDEAPDSVRQLLEAEVDVEFHAHSQSHPTRDDANVSFEVETSVNRVRDEFDTDPVGYRFPDGAAYNEDYYTLAEHEVPFNASLFPSWRPGRFNNRDAPMHPFKHIESGVIELPFTVYSEEIRIPVALSYLKLFGYPFQQLVYRHPPSAIVFDMHMHDLVTPPAFQKLPTQYQIIYSRNKNNGINILNNFINSLKYSGYTFSTMNQLYKETAKYA